MRVSIAKATNSYISLITAYFACLKRSAEVAAKPALEELP